MATPKSALRHRPIGGDSTLTVPIITQRRSRATATTRSTPPTHQNEQPYEAETIELVDEVEEGDDDEDVEMGRLGIEEGRRPVPQTRQLRSRITEEPTDSGRGTTTRSVALRKSPQTIVRKSGLIDIRWLIFFLVCGSLMVLILNLAAVTVRNFAYTQYLSTTTGTTPTAQLDATLHGHQIHFIAVLLHQHFEVIAIDETDAKQTQLYPDTNPLLSDQGSVTLGLELRDVNGDGKPDLVISATSPTVNFFWQPSAITVILLNSDGLHFKPM